MDVFTEQQARTELSEMYDTTEVSEILGTANASGIFADEIAWQGSNLHVSVRAHQMSVNEPVSYTIVIRP